MNDFFKSMIPEIENNWNEIESMFQNITLPPKSTLLLEGDVADRVYFINRGCLRLWFNDDGKDITFQFFFENQIVSSFESFYNCQPSLFNIETIELSDVSMITKKDMQKLIARFPILNEYFIKILSDRFICYTKLFLSRIKNSPKERYKELIENDSQVIKRIPHHYIASYLGITPVSLSRIRKRIDADINNC